MGLKQESRYFVIFVPVILAVLTAMSPLAIDTYLPAMPAMAKVFGVGIQKVQITITLYFLGFALGNFFGGPLSDSFGRKPIAISGIVLYGLSAVLIVFTHRIEEVWILRFLQAFGGGFGTVTVMVFVKDWFDGKQVARMATIIGMIMMLAPLFAPIIGTLLIRNYSWTGIFWFLASFALMLLLIIGLILPESLKPEQIPRRFRTRQLLGKYIPFFRSRKAILMLLAISFSTAGMFVFITGASYLYIDYYGFGLNIFPLLFSANIVLNILLSFLNTLLLKKFEPEALLRAGMILQLIAGVVIGIAVLAMDKPLFEAVFAANILFIGSLGLIFGNGTAIILNLLPGISGSANATIGVSRFLVSFIAGTIPSLFKAESILPLGITMLACTFIANVFGYFFHKMQTS
ncbi:MAG: multidrug effflux MFS transporter [Bacteroidales bacterium]|nr:multidrug effflux MFS transporter [Bacteroidales bacterium]